MKSILFTLLLTTIAFGDKALAQDYKLGLGLRLSNASPTISNSVSAKYFIKQQDALEALVSFGDRFGIGLLYEKHRSFTNESGLRWFYGFGGYAGFQGGDTYLGPAGVLGFDYKFKDVPLNISLDWKPELDIIPKVNLVPDAFGLTARYTLF